MFRVLIKVFVYKICVLVLFIDYCFGINNVVISNVPNKNIYFIGRDNELNKIKTSFKEQNILAIVGSAGIGKTQIAKQYANNSAEYDLIWWIESGKSIVAQYLKLVDDLNGKQLLAEKLYVPMNSEAKAIKKVRDILENLCMNMLFIFDDFDNYAEIKDLIPTSTACPKKKLSVLVTSKNLLSWNNSIRIEEFHRDESINLFRQFIGNRDTQSMNKLSEALGDYPIAITQAAVYLKTNPNMSVEQYIELFYNRRVALWGYEEKLVTQHDADLDNYKKTVFTAVGINVKELKQKSENAFKLALLISFMHSSDIPEKILKKNFKDILEMNEAISSIQSNALLVLNGRRNTEVDLDNFYSIHEVQQAVIRDLATDNEKKESIKKLAENLNALLPKQIDLFVPMLIEKPYLIQHLEKVCKHAKKLNILDDNILNLHIRRLEYVLSFKKDFNTAAEIIQNIEGLLMQAPKSIISSLTKSRFKLMELTYLSWHKGAYQTSIEMANNVLEDLAKLSDVDEEYLMAYNKLAQSYMYIGDVENGLKYSDLGQKVVDHTVGYLGNKDAFYATRARILLDLGKFEEALDNIKLSSAHAQKWERPMTILATQALILFKMAKYRESYDAVNESFKAACSMFGDEDSPLAALQLTIIAASSLKLGNIEEANFNIERALKILQETYKDNIHRSYAFAYIVYGDIKVAQGLYDEAQNAYLLADSMYCKVMLNKKIDDVSYLYMQLAINSARLSDKLRSFFYLDEHRDLFGEANKRTLAIIKHFYANGLINQ